MLGLIFCLAPSIVSAEEKKEPGVAVAKKEKVSPQVKELQDQQQKLRLDYEKNKKDLHAQMKDTIKNFKEETGQPTLQDIVKANNKKQDELRSSFQDELRKLQAQERKLRLGRESVERPELSGKQGAVYKKALTEKERRLEFQKRRQEQDKVLQRDRGQDNQPRSLPRPVVPSSPVPSPSTTVPKSTVPASDSTTETTPPKPKIINIGDGY